MKNHHTKKTKKIVCYSTGRMSQDMKEINRFMCPFVKLIKKSIGSHNIIDICTILRTHSKFKNGGPKEHVVKKDILELMKYLLERGEPLLKVSNRTLSRTKFEYKNMIFTYFAYQHPDLMYEVMQNLNQFPLITKLNNIPKFVYEWNSMVESIQRIKRSDIQNDPPDFIQNFDLFSTEEEYNCDNEFGSPFDLNFYY